MRNVKDQEAVGSRQKAAERVQGGTAALGSTGAGEEQKAVGRRQ